MVITIRNVDRNTWHRFKVTAVKSRLTVGFALNRALNSWIDSHSKEDEQSCYGLDIKPFKAKSIPKDLSRNVDKYLYGE
ncbi:hypothetical protein HZA96_06740 [Candidatus Woesearchaeota archaeon]|nr:hypothetical protein [Candidatus Woesearchaeota archaeon]